MSTKYTIGIIVVITLYGMFSIFVYKNDKHHRDAIIKAHRKAEEERKRVERASRGVGDIYIGRGGRRWQMQESGEWKEIAPLQGSKGKRSNNKHK